MTAIRTLNHALRLTLLVIMLAACSFELSDVTPAPTRPAPTLAPESTGAPAATEPAQTGPALTESAPTESALTGSAPPPWADLNLSGSLIYTQGVNGIVKLDLTTGAIASLMPPKDNIWLSAAAVSPDGGTIALAYSPPPPGNEVQLGYTGLYALPNNGAPAEPSVILERATPQESYFSPAWSADGKFLYFAHFTPILSDNGNTFKYTIERIPYPPTAAAPEVIIEDAIWPKVSPDGARLAYLKFDTEKYTQELYMSDLDGNNAAPVLAPGVFPSVDAQFFSPDGQTLIFNAVGDAPAPAVSFLDWLMGVRGAGAHNVPSDWWSVQIGSAEPPVRLTTLYDTGMYGDFSPDGSYVAFISASGIYVMRPDGSGVRPIAPIEALGTLEWSP